MRNKPRYPTITIAVGDEMTELALLTDARTALKDAGVEPGEVDEFTDNAAADDRMHLLHTIRAWMTVID